jgi:hypothetical protein
MNEEVGGDRRLCACSEEYKGSVIKYLRLGWSEEGGVEVEE